jgi:phosphoribosylglycinamide formyltransferase-1
MTASVVVLISGRGSNLQALLDAGIPVSAVISNVPGAAGLAIAAGRGIAVATLPHRDYASRELFDQALAKAIDAHAPALVVLAGFMRVLTAGFVQRYAGRLMNIHPSLLPVFPGLDTHRRALEEGVKLHGCTAHFVTADLDHGPIIAQAAVPVGCDDTESALAARVLRQEHVIYPRAVRWFLDGKLVIEQGRVRVKGEDAQFHFSDRI